MGQVTTGSWVADAWSACVAQFFANHSPQNFLQRFLRAFDVLPQGVVDQRLVVTAAHFVNLASKPSQDLIVKPNGNPGFASRPVIGKTTPILIESLFDDLLFWHPDKIAKANMTKLIVKRNLGHRRIFLSVNFRVTAVAPLRSPLRKPRTFISI